MRDARFLYAITGDEVKEIISEHLCKDDMPEDEINFICDYIQASKDVIKDDIKASLWSCVEHYVSEIRTEYLAALASTQNEDDAYERFKQKEIEG